MSVMARMAVRTAVELLLILAGWGLLIAAIAIAIAGQLVAAVILLVGSVVAFWLHARSLRSKPSAAYLYEFEQGKRR
ncbi:hypothetical protein ACGGZK_15415 [Agromyces sp. MMS24-K17]|uniref:hypothetical protein n=1 Tax=Agromyces sp. MMS24-K17 TaxID=3372850 RepID=UPI0037540751